MWTFTLHEVRKKKKNRWRKRIVFQECVCVSEKEDGTFEMVVT